MKKHQPLNFPENDDSYFIGEIKRKFSLGKLRGNFRGNLECGFAQPSLSIYLYDVKWTDVLNKLANAQ
jgi:hypothetical protein